MLSLLKLFLRRLSSAVGLNAKVSDIFKVLFCLLGALFVLFYLTKARILKTEIVSQERPEATQIDLSEKLEETTSIIEEGLEKDRTTNLGIDSKDNVWCQARDYKDLSNDPTILEFQIWTEQLRKMACLAEQDGCLDHDPRFLHAFFKKGEELAEARKPILSQIIRGNPRKALELAVSKNLRSVLPTNITAHLEQWESEVVDIRSVHLCFTDYHPGGYVKTTASFPDGRNLRTWSFGSRYKLPVRKGLAVWGISLGEDLAISDQPYQVSEKDEKSGVIEFAGESIAYNGTAERDLLLHEIDEAEDRYRSRRGSIHKIMYPTALASSMTADAILEAKYELNTTRATFDEALSSAISQNGYLLQFKDEAENKLIRNWLKEKHDKNQLFSGLDENNVSVSLLWLGGTDNEEVNGTTFDRETNTTSQNREISASEGDWKWLNGESWSYQNWKTGFGIERNSTTQDFVAFDWNETSGTWEDINETARLPFIIEKDNDVATIESDLKGIRKVLVVPARFLDETVYYKSVLGGSNFLLTNEFDEEILQELKADSYEPASRAEIERAMQTVRDYFSRNTDGELDLVPVITPTVTMISSDFFPLEPPVTRYVPINEKGAVYPGYSQSYKSTTSGPNLFDSEGNFTTLAEAVYQELPVDPDLPSIDVLAMAAAAEQSEDWNFEGFAFVGLSSLSLAGSSIDTNFSSPPTVKIVGGEAPNAQGLPHPRFRAAEAEVFLDEDGDVIGANVLEPGTYYMDGAAPQIFLNGVDYTDDFVTTVEYILVSTVALTNYSAGAPGMAWIGGVGSFVKITDGKVPEGTVAHEIGHNFGLWHSNIYNPRSEHPLSDDADVVEYGNEFSVMGGGKNIAQTGDLSAPEKVRLNIFFNGQSGYNLGNALGDDVADLTDEATLETSQLKETNSTVANTFRLYRSNYGSPPRKLREIAFSLKLPEAEEEFLKELGGSPYPVQFDGAGEEAAGYLDLNDMELVITEGGRGFVQEPLVRVLDVNDSVLMTLNPAWLVVPNGRDFNQTATLLSYAPEDRWIRGVRISGATGLVRPTNLNIEGLLGATLTDYYITYRTDFSEHGIMLEVANDPDEAKGDLEPFLLDATPNTPRNNDTDFNDHALLIGTTYSDYDADIHITPIKVGGTDPMPYIECVINMDTVNGGEAQAPDFVLSVSDENPSSLEYVELSVAVKDGNSSQYAYSWFVNEVQLSQPLYLNQPAINYQFTDPGRYVIRVLVSDMKGGISSRNLIVTVDGDETTNKSLLSGVVRSSQGPVQGARVILEKAPVIEHRVSLEGNLYDSFFPDGSNNPARFNIDGEDSPDLLFRRGEIHRFVFDKSADGITMSFLEQPENTTPRVHINMLSDPRADLEKGSKYLRTPQISYKFNSAFSTYQTDQVGTYLELLHYLYKRNGTVVNIDDDNGTTLELLEYLDNENLSIFEDSKNLITRPFAKALMGEDNVSKAIVGPMEITELGYYTFGGRGYSRSDPPVMTIRRSSIWENYSKEEANGTAFVDGVNTISPVISTEFLGSTWITRSNDDPVPDLVVWGSGALDEDDLYDEVNASIISWTDDGSPMRTININNQGKGFEPNSTMAVLHYPQAPFAYWSFDRHETLFEDATEARHQPSPAWNREHSPSALIHYWTFDENVSGGVANEIAGGASFDLASGALNEGNFSNWGLLGRALDLDVGKELTTSTFAFSDNNFTFSVWLRPADGCTFDLTIGGQTTNFNSDNFQFETDLPLSPQVLGYWTHLAVVHSDTVSYLYVDGRKELINPAFTPANSVITLGNISVANLFLDEARLYSTAMSEAEVRYLAGRNILDLSSNKYHAVSIGPNTVFTAPDQNMSSADTPSDDPTSGSTNGSGVLGDSFDGEDNGKSVTFDGISQFLDITMHKGEFALPEGTITMWVKPSVQQNTAPLFSFGSPYVAEPGTEDNTLQTPGSLFSLELTSGWPRFAGFRAFRSQDKVRPGDWHYLVATFPEVKIWINNKEVPTAPASSGLDQFEENFDLLSLSIDAEFFRIGYSYDRSALDPLPLTPPEAYFDGSIDDVAIYDRILNGDEMEFLYELRRGKEQIPRLEAVVDAVGTTIIHRGGEGYRENPDLVFWYGAEENKTDIEHNFSTLADLKTHFTETNGTHGLFAYVEDEDLVYTFHQGQSSSRQYTWRSGQANGWRKLISATGIGEFENASLADVVWTKRMDSPTDMPLPDGRMVQKRYIDYVTMDENNSFSLERNDSLALPFGYYKPNGLYGFIEKVNLEVASPTEHNADATTVNLAEAFVHFYIDPDANESISIIDPGIGASAIPLGNIKISGSGYQPATPNQNEEEHAGSAEIDTNLEAAGQVGWGPFVQYDWNGSEDVNISTPEFNNSYLSVDVDNPGFDYAMPLEFKVIGGRPQIYDDFFTTPLPEYNSSNSYVFEEAEFAVTSVGVDGSIESIEVTKMGQGYVDYDQLNGDDKELFGLLLTELGHDLANYPLIMVTGGGGHGATFKATVDANGSITGTTPISGGRGYVNTISNNRPRLVHTPTLEPGERNASLEVMLGGYLKEIPRCTDCESGIVHNGKVFSHTEPWIEIWDRGRKEEDIDTMGARAHAAPKVVNGKIEKVIVTNSGTGYIDPVVMVRDAPPNHVTYSINKGRKWKCTFKRSLSTGEKVECGHVHLGVYPPEECPGETDELLPFADENGTMIIATGDQLEAWKTRHDAPEHHQHCTESDAHLGVQFLVRKCWGTKMNYILHDDALYRTPRADWAHLDANLSIISKNGRIREIVVENSGSNYYATQIFVEGTGAGVDAIPIFDNVGVNTEVIFDDPRIKNLEFDRVSRPLGAGQGFRERPWAWDESPRTYNYSSAVENNDPLWGEDERVDVIVIHSELKATWNFGQPILADYTGDRIMEIDIVDPGLYSAGTDLSVTLEYNSLGSLDQNKDGVADFIEGSVSELTTTRLTKFVLDDNASYDFNNSGTIIERGLFDENPRVQILDGRNVSGASAITYSNETGTSFIRNNDKISYNSNPDKGYIELYIDDRFPSQLYYGEGITTGNASMVVPAFGGKIIVTDPVPGGSWALDEVNTKPNFSYTDQNGYYAFTNLDWGMYNVAVFLEDQKFQESTFRSAKNASRVSEFTYVAGFPDLLLETDNFGPGQSSLLWSRESRALSRSSTGPYDKSLVGIGRGFDPSIEPPELTIIPHDGNLVYTIPNIDVEVLVDGSLKLEIIDEESSVQYFPGDKFTIRYANPVYGVDFIESFLYSETNQTFNSGVLSSWDYDNANLGLERYQSPAKLVISPDDSNGTNLLEASLSTEAFGEVANSFRAQVFDVNGTELNASMVKWQISLDFNASVGDNSKVALLEGSSGLRDLNASGAEIDLYLFSLLRENSGSVHQVEIINGGTGYSSGDRLRINDPRGFGFDANITEVNATGGITDINVTHRGFDYSAPFDLEILDADRIDASSGTGAILEVIQPRGYLLLEANFTLPEGEILSRAVKIKASARQSLNSQEVWLEKYLDSFVENNDSWWEQDMNETNPFEDLDDDNLSNFEEWSLGSNPLDSDTDRDRLPDLNESLFGSSLIQEDTEGDGLDDYSESEVGTNPLISDTDGDGLSDLIDSDPNNAAGVGIMSGKIFVMSKYAGSTPYFRSAVSADINTSTWLSSWDYGPKSFYLDSLNYDSNYTLQVFIDTINDGIYSEGEPFVEFPVFLSNDQLGIGLVPMDPNPTISFSDPGASLIEIDLQEANQSNQFEWGVVAEDPYYSAKYGELEWEVDSNKSDRYIEIEGNLTQYLLNLPTSGYVFPSLMTIDLQAAPAGIYKIYYTARDSFANQSDALEQTIVINDAQAPFITILDLVESRGITTELNTTIGDVYSSYEDLNLSYYIQDGNGVGSGYLSWERGRPFELEDLFVEVRDNKSGDLEWQVDYIDNAEEELANSTTLGDYVLQFTAEDEAGNSMFFQLTVELVDTREPTVTITGDRVDVSNSIEVYRNIGTFLEDEISIEVDDGYGNYSALANYENNFTDFTIDWDDLNYSSQDNKHFIMPGDESNYTIRFTFTDETNNSGYQELLIKPIDPKLTIAARAMDGYLNGATVTFGDHEVLTDENGSFSIYVTHEEFDALDLNQNGKLEVSEAKIAVSGGMDVDTNASFPSVLFADWNSSVVSPITSLIASLLEQGLVSDKQEANQKVAEAFDLNMSLDLSHYDPYAQVELDDNDSLNVLVANLRIANLLLQMESLLQAYPFYENGTIGNAIFIQIATRVAANPQTFDLTDVTTAEIIEDAHSTIGVYGNLDDMLTETDLDRMVQVISKCDPIHIYNDVTGLSLDDQKEQIIIHQIWVDENIVDDIRGGNWNSVTLSGLLDLLEENEPNERRIRDFNLFAPEASNFSGRLNQEVLRNDCILELQSHDGDGDEIFHSLILGNGDHDMDGTPLFNLSQDGKLCLSDEDELRFISGKSIQLMLTLDDGYGRRNIVEGELGVDSLLAIESHDLGASWYQSDWFGTFNYQPSGWVYHARLGWLYLYDDGSGSFWLWDTKWNTWWWSSEEIFPWIYRDDSANWHYLIVLPDMVSVFNAELMTWSLRE